MNIELTEIQKAVVYQQGAILSTLRAMKEVTPAIEFNHFLKAFTQDIIEKLTEVVASTGENYGK